MPRIEGVGALAQVLARPLVCQMVVPRAGGLPFDNVDHTAPNKSLRYVVVEQVVAHNTSQSLPSATLFGPKFAEEEGRSEFNRDDRNRMT